MICKTSDMRLDGCGIGSCHFEGDVFDLSSDDSSGTPGTCIPDIWIYSRYLDKLFDIKIYSRYRDTIPILIYSRYLENGDKMGKEVSLFRV